MATLTKQKQFEIIRTVLAMVEEQKSLPLSDCAAAVGIDEDALRLVLDQVLYLNYHTSREDLLIDESAAFLLDQDGIISLTKNHWLRELESEAPDRDGALRLLIAGQIMQALLPEPNSALDHALIKLQHEVAIELRIPVDVPPALAIVQEAMVAHRSIKIKYRSERSDVFIARELLPFRIWSRWGDWFLNARDITEKETKTFRIDRMNHATAGDQKIDQIPWTEVPESFLLRDRTQIVRVAITAEAMDSLPTTIKQSNQTDASNGQIEVDLSVSGDRQINHLLISLPAATKIISPPEFVERRRTLAAALLAELS